MEKYDFSGWATRNDLLCGDGRTIRRNAFKDNDGQVVPLVWNHQHNDPEAVLGHALLENRDDGVYAYGVFNDTDAGQNAKKLLMHGDVRCLSICANKLKQIGKDVIHGSIRELSLVLAGANPGAYIDFVMSHSEDGEDELQACYDESALTIYHSDDEKKEEPKMADNKEKTIGEIFETMTEEQKNAAYAMVAMAIEGDVDDEDEDDDNEGDDVDMKHNVFDNDYETGSEVLTHAGQVEILNMAKSSSVGSLREAMAIYADEHSDTLAHGFVNEAGEDGIDMLFPEFKDVKTGAPELLERDLTWVDYVMRGVHKTPISRIRTRFADARSAELRAKGYKGKGNEKKLSGDITLVQRTTDPQTVYRKDTMHRDDIIDITDFDVVEYQYKVMRHNMEEELALAIMIGDGREEDDADKISEKHIRSIWNDNEMYTIHADVDIAAAKEELQGSDTSVHFGDNYIYAEAIITAALYSREKYKGKGNLEFYCTPHLLNVMLLARDLNGRRIYESKADLASALNVRAIHTVEQFEGKIRTDKDGNQKKLLGLFVNLSDYYVGSTKGGEITRFSDFDIDFNQYKYLIETRLSGAMVNLYSAIALEEPVAND